METMMENTSKSTLRLQLANALAALAALGMPAEELDLGEGEGEHLVELANTLAKQQRLSDNAELEDYRLRESAIRKAVGDAEPGERTVLDSVRRVVTNLRNATRNPGSVVDMGDAEIVAARTARGAFWAMMRTPRDQRSVPPTWGEMELTFGRWKAALERLANALQPSHITDRSADPVHEWNVQRWVDLVTEFTTRSAKAAQPVVGCPEIDPDDEAVVAADVVGIKRVSDDVISVKFKLVWPEDVGAIALGRAWMHFGVPVV